jgi:threonine/homoserine/homoserine lactone efflux protein
MPWAAYGAFLAFAIVLVLVPGPDIAAAAGGRGFLSNITNPKVLVFSLAVLPQFLPGHAGVAMLVAFALSHAVLSLGCSLLLTLALQRAHPILECRRVRRALDATTGAVLIGFSARLVAEHA